MLPLLPDAQRALEMAADQEKDEDDDEEIDGHEGRPLRVYDHRLQCEDCGALGSVGCRACKDNRLEVSLWSNTCMCMHTSSKRCALASQVNAILYVL